MGTRTQRTVLAKTPPQSYILGEIVLQFTRDEIGRTHEDALTQGLISDHLGEIQDLPFESSLNLAVYARLEQTGNLQVFTIRDGDRLAGYSAYVTSEVPAVKDEVRAHQEHLFIHPDYRKGFLPIAFMRWCDDQLFSMGCKLIITEVPYGGRDFGPVLKRLHYRPLSTLYARRAEWDQEQVEVAGTSGNTH